MLSERFEMFYDDSTITMLDDKENCQVIIYSRGRKAITLCYDNNFFDVSDVKDAYEELIKDIAPYCSKDEIAESRECFEKYYNEHCRKEED